MRFILYLACLAYLSADTTMGSPQQEEETGYILQEPAEPPSRLYNTPTVPPPPTVPTRTTRPPTTPEQQPPVTPDRLYGQPDATDESGDRGTALFPNSQQVPTEQPTQQQQFLPKQPQIHPFQQPPKQIPEGPLTQPSQQLQRQPPKQLPTQFTQEPRKKQPPQVTHQTERPRPVSTTPSPTPRKTQDPGSQTLPTHGGVMMGMPYEIDWSVNDIDSGNVYSHQERSDGTVAQGEYRVLLPDGRLQVVSFVDRGRGYEAKVRYEKWTGGHALQ